jgi:coproporphyrinogen III oxidase
MSLPPAVQWKYNVSPAPDSEEERLVRVLQKPINWIKQ